MHSSQSIFLKLKEYISQYNFAREELTSLVAKNENNTIKVKYLQNQMELLILKMLITAVQTTEGRQWLLEERDGQVGYVTLLAEGYFVFKTRQFLNLSDQDDTSDYINQIITKIMPEIESIIDKLNPKKSSSPKLFQDKDALVVYHKISIDKMHELITSIYHKKFTLLFSAFKEIKSLKAIMTTIIDSVDNLHITLLKLHDSLDYRKMKRTKLMSELKESSDRQTSAHSSPLNQINYSELVKEIEKTLQNEKDKFTPEEIAMFLSCSNEYRAMLLTFHAKLPNNTYIQFSGEAVSPTDNDLGFIGLRASRSEVAEGLSLLNKNTELKIREQLAEEIQQAFESGELDAEEGKILVKNKKDKKQAFNKLINNLKKEFASHPSMDEIKPSNQESILISLLQEAKRDEVHSFRALRGDSFNADEALKIYCHKESTFNLYMEAIQKHLQLSYKSAMLYTKHIQAKQAPINLFIWHRANKNSDQLILTDYCEVPESKQTVHMLKNDSGVIHSNLVPRKF